jgi:hypothetical protein
VSDDNTASKNYYRRLAEELAEADEPRNRAQAQLDRWWEVSVPLRKRHRTFITSVVFRNGGRRLQATPRVGAIAIGVSSD